MLSNPSELREKILFEPISHGADKLRIITGYSAHTMVSWHITEIAKRFDRAVNIDLTVGMCIRDRLFRPIHEGFKSIMKNGYGDCKSKLTCKYITEGSPVHTKIYLWEKDEKPFRAFTGSANYTQPAFFGRHRESMCECDSEEAAEYLDSLEEDSTYCTHADIEDKIIITEKPQRLITLGTENDHDRLSSISVQGLGVKEVRLPLIIVRGKRKGEVHVHSGINWGQREGREPNQAYIPVPSDIRNSDFFPDIGIHFSVTTDDGKILILSRGQHKGKGMSTPQNNSLLGEYLRNRLGLANGVFVSKEDFERYGRSDVTFYKLDDEQYFMDFSRPEGETGNE